MALTNILKLLILRSTKCRIWSFRATKFFFCRGLLGVCELKVAHPDQVISRGRQGEHPAYAFQTSEAGLALQCHGLDPAENLLDPLPLLLADGIAFMSGGTIVDGAPTVRIVLCHLRRHLQFSSRSYQSYEYRNRGLRRVSRASIPVCRLSSRGPPRARRSRSPALTAHPPRVHSGSMSVHAPNIPVALPLHGSS
jgi:hypothetical protein